ncbi:MAG: phage tail protein [Desulfobulbaceae bacterium]|jgi:hypothetical protein|nr:phage tail protein [Desulfobulbaceae bacterium]
MAAYNPALDQSKEDNTPPRSGIGSFGPVVFEVSNDIMALVRDVRRKTAARVEEHRVVGAKPRVEFLAADLAETTFKVFWNIGFGVNPRKEIGRLRQLCEAGTVGRLILGGENFGQHLLIEVSESWLRSGPNGAPMVAEAHLVFKEYQ